MEMLCYEYLRLCPFLLSTDLYRAIVSWVAAEPGQISEMMHGASLQRRHTLCLKVKTTRVCGKRDENLRR